MANQTRRGPTRLSGTSSKHGAPQKREENRSPANRGPGISAATIAKLRATPPTKQQDDELRESLRLHGWLPHLPAKRDEHGVVLVGNRRVRLAAELGIEPNIETETFGDGEEADNRRIQTALASNVGGAPITRASRKAFAISLYKTENWTQERIAKFVGVSQAMVSKYLKGIYNLVINSPSQKKNRGRPRGSVGKKKPKPKSIEAPTTVEAPVAVKASIVPTNDAFVSPPSEASITPIVPTIDSHRGVMPKAEFNIIRECLRIDSIEKIVKRGAVDEDTKGRYANALAILEKHETALVISAAAKGETPR